MNQPLTNYGVIMPSIDITENGTHVETSGVEGDPIYIHVGWEDSDFDFDLENGTDYADNIKLTSTEAKDLAFALLEFLGIDIN
jgi:hypothetical protein